MVQVTEDYHPPDPDYWEEIMTQFGLDDATVEADLIVEEVSFNMIEPESGMMSHCVMMSPVLRTLLVSCVPPHHLVLHCTLSS